MESNSLRPSSLGAVASRESLGGDIRSRANMLKGLTSPGAQMNNTDNYKSIPLDKLVEFAGHPFKVNDDSELAELAESIKESGLMEAILVRPTENGLYEILAGHRRVAACKKIGGDDVSAKVLNVDNDEAVIIMTNTNLKRREKILTSERGKAYKMQLEAYKCQGKRSDLLLLIQDELNFGQNLPEVRQDKEDDFGQNLPKVNSRDIVAQINSITAREVSSYIRLNELIQSLLDLVDIDEIPFYAGVALSFLDEQQQQQVAEAMKNGIIKKIDLKSAEELKHISKKGQLNETVIAQLFAKNEDAKPESPYKVFQSATKNVLKHLKKTDYGDVEIDSAEIEQIILQAVKKYVEERT